MKHIYDWIEEPAKDDAERDAKEWLDQFTRPAIREDDEWLARYTVTCEYRGERWVCSGASRMGDVWLKKPDSQNFYDKRVDVEECTNWKRIINPRKS